MSLALALACAVGLGGPVAADPPTPAAREFTIPGKVRTPDGTSYRVQLSIVLNKDNSFTGTLTYDLGLRQQPFEVEGALTNKGLTFHDRPGKQVHVHPHSPVLAAGTCEATSDSDDGYRGVIRVRQRSSSPTEVFETGAGMRPAPECTVIFGWRALIGT
jgi:hypothetical protein